MFCFFKSHLVSCLLIYYLFYRNNFVFHCVVVMVHLIWIRHKLNYFVVLYNYHDYWSTANELICLRWMMLKKATNEYEWFMQCELRTRRIILYILYTILIHCRDRGKITKLFIYLLHFELKTNWPDFLIYNLHAVYRWILAKKIPQRNSRTEIHFFFIDVIFIRIFICDDIDCMQ